MKKVPNQNMKKKKKIKKKESKKKKKETEEKEEESELEEEVEEQEIPNISRFRQFIEVKSSGAPILERVTQEEPEITSLEQGMGVTPVSEKKEELERKYEETLRYDIESQYQESLKRQREITPEMISQVAPVSTIDLETVGRERIVPGSEFHMSTPAEMPTAPASKEEYDIVPVKKSKKFRGETTNFQEN